MRAVLIVMAVAGTARAEPRRLAIPTPAPQPVASGAPISNVIYLERCVGDCTIHGGTTNDAKSLTTTIPQPGIYRISEFKNASKQSGSAADAEWQQLVQCVREVYSPYDVQITDVKPTSGTYHLAMVAGFPNEMGLESNVLGVAPLASNCAAFDNVMSFSFANAHTQGDPTQHVLNVCWTAAQESAHAFGLDHEFEFTSGRSACNDPMTYRMDCGGQKFFRNLQARCGEDEERECRCTSTQNSHRILAQLFGAGTPLTTPPQIAMTIPAGSGGPLPANVVVTASAQRGILKLQLFMNGFPMTEVSGVEFGPDGQPEAGYGLVPPADMPGSIYDLFVRASDDLGTFTDTPTVTVTHGTPCVTADTCLAEQKCDQGHCFWDPPVGEIGDACTYPQFCKSLLCRGTTDLQICTQTCDPEDPEGCPSGMDCVSNVCFPVDGGCCSTSREGWMPAGMLAFLCVAGMLRRRRT